MEESRRRDNYRDFREYTREKPREMKGNVSQEVGTVESNNRLFEKRRYAWRAGVKSGL